MFARSCMEGSPRHALSRFCHQRGRNSRAMILNQGDQRSPEPGSIISASSDGVTYRVACADCAREISW